MPVNIILNQIWLEGMVWASLVALKCSMVQEAELSSRETSLLKPGSIIS